MVKVYQLDVPQSLTDESFEQWFSSLAGSKELHLTPPWQNVLKLLTSVSVSGNSLALSKLAQGFEMAHILAELDANPNSVLAALLFPLFDSNLVSLETIKAESSALVAHQLQGVASMSAISSLQAESEDLSADPEHIDNFRRMLLAMVDDVRVVLIKLAERLYLLRQAVKGDKEDKAQDHILAREVSEIYAPLANRLGIGALKWEMEDLAFRLLHSDEYINIAKSLAEKRVAREVYVKDVLAMIGDSLKALHIDGDLQGRAKHIFSIWKKMQRKNVGFEEIYDVRAVRILVPNIQDCYSVLGVIHGLWKHIPKEFDDYIATPKENGYRSLHTAVVGPQGKTLEVQIRTFNMHQESELGVAAHWKYKEGTAGIADSYEAKILWLRQLLEWQDEVSAGSDILGEFRNQVVEERVYVFTPGGKLIDLPSGATALDFAYRVHTDVGHRCRGAKTNGRIVALTQPLETGQRVEILTSKTGGPSRDWLIESRGYIKSSRARSKINQWFRHQDKDKNSAAGKSMFEKESQFLKPKADDINKLAKHFNFNNQDELFASIGAGDKGLHQVLNALQSLVKKVVVTKPRVKAPKVMAKRSASSDILVEGVANLLTRLAGCCKPIPGDKIAGFVTQGRGIMVHRDDCHYLVNSRDVSPQKILQVAWSDSLNQKYLIDLKIKAFDHAGLLDDINQLLGDEKVNVTSLKTQVNQRRLMKTIHLQIQLASIAQVSRISSLLKQLPRVESVVRK